MSGHPILPPDPITLPLLPLRDVVVFPHMVIPLFVGRPKSIKALEAAMEAGRQIMLVAQKAAGKDEPKPEDMFEIGCVSSILQMLKLPDGTVKVLVEGVQRAETQAIHDTAEHFTADVVPVQPAGEPSPEVEALRRAVFGDVCGASAHEALHLRNRVVRCFRCAALGRLTNDRRNPGSIANHRRKKCLSVLIKKALRISVAHHRNQRVRGAKVDSDDATFTRFLGRGLARLGNLKQAHRCTLGLLAKVDDGRRTKSATLRGLIARPCGQLALLRIPQCRRRSAGNSAAQRPSRSARTARRDLLVPDGQSLRAVAQRAAAARIRSCA